MDFLKKQLENIIKFIKLVSRKIILPGFKGYSLYYVGSFFIKGVQKGAIAIRARSVAFNMFIAVFPALIFLFSLIPFIPIDNFQNDLFKLLEDTMSQSLYKLLFETISDTLLNQNSSALSIGLLLMLIFSSNGVMALIEAFNNTYFETDNRNRISQRLISIFLVVIMSVLFIIAISLIVTGNNFIAEFISLHDAFQEFEGLIFYVVGAIKWIFIVLLYFFATSFLYYLAPAKKSRFRFISPGAIFATFLQIVTSLGFAYYVNNFAQYNKLYGSIGTVVIVMLIFYITSLALILGYELNVSILTSKKNISIKNK